MVGVAPSVCGAVAAFAVTDAVAKLGSRDVAIERKGTSLCGEKACGSESRKMQSTKHVPSFGTVTDVTGYSGSACL